MESEDIGHNCGFVLLRLLRPLEYYIEKYNSVSYGLWHTYLLMEKQRNRGQDGAGIACVKLNMQPGYQFIDVAKSCRGDPIKEVMSQAESEMQAKLQNLDAAKRRSGRSLKHSVPFTGEVWLGHVRYGTDSDNNESKCHPICHENNWKTRNLVLAGNFNLTNVNELFSDLVELGQHPREKSDTITLLENISHYLDVENNDLYVRYFGAGHSVKSAFNKVGESINIQRILKQAAKDWDGGYVVSGILGHGDAFSLRDPSGIRPAFFYHDDEVAVVASERPVLQSIFSTSAESIKEVPPGHAIIIRQNGEISSVRCKEPLHYSPCSFERIYFSRGGDRDIYKEREDLGKTLYPLVMAALGDEPLSNVVFSYIPNTAELSYIGLLKEVMRRHPHQDNSEGCNNDITGDVLDVDGVPVASGYRGIRFEKICFKDAKLRTFIQADQSRPFMVSHAYDVAYGGSVRPGIDTLIVVDDSIVRGTTLHNSILRSLDRLHAKKIIFVSSAPQIRYPDCYGIDIAKFDDLIAFRAAWKLSEERHLQSEIRSIYDRCVLQQKWPVKPSLPTPDALKINHVKALYAPFTAEEISAKIAQLVTPDNMKTPVTVVYQSIEGLHKAIPVHSGDWYFTGNYPTPGGTKIAAKAFINTYEGRKERAYGVPQDSLGKCCLILGSGGREHALAVSVARSPQVGAVWVVPGNAGTSDHPIGNVLIRNAPETLLDPVDDFAALKTFCHSSAVDLVIVGPEVLLCQGVVDSLERAKITVFGPSKAAAELESSKAFSKAFMTRHGIPTAKYASFTSRQLDEAINYIKKCPHPVVVKASGIAAGKGVVVPENQEEAISAVKACLEQKQFGEAGEVVVLEELLEGQEVSIFGISDGTRVVAMCPAQDHKRALDFDKGPNTGGMGAYCPTPFCPQSLLEEITEKILQPTIDGMAKEGRPFKGCLFAGLMLSPLYPASRQLSSDGTEIFPGGVVTYESGTVRLNCLEFNCRFGDPETQSVLSLLKTDCYDFLYQAAMGTLDPSMVAFHNAAACNVVIASGGYPQGPVQKGYVISGLKNAERIPGVSVFHAGTRLSEKVVPTAHDDATTAPTPGERQRVVTTNGGRVLNVVAVAPSLEEAQRNAYAAAQCISFLGAFYRKDIAEKGLHAARDIQMAIRGGGEDSEGKFGKSRPQPLPSCASTAIEGGEGLEGDGGRGGGDMGGGVSLLPGGLPSGSTPFAPLSPTYRRSSVSSARTPTASHLPPVSQPNGNLQRLTYQYAGVDIGAGDNADEAVLTIAAATNTTSCRLIDMDAPIAATPPPLQKSQQQPTSPQDSTPAREQNEENPNASLCSLPRTPTQKRHGRCYLSPLLSSLSSSLATSTPPPILISVCNAVGTKLKIAETVGRFEGIGEDVAALCANDLICQRATPLFITDFFASGRQDIATQIAIAQGIAQQCERGGFTFFPGERAQLPGVFTSKGSVAAGFMVGAMHPSRAQQQADEACDPYTVEEGDVIIGIASNGLHANGFSLVRTIMSLHDVTYTTPAPFDPSRTFGEVLLAPTRNYTSSVLPLMIDCSTSLKLQGGINEKTADPISKIKKALQISSRGLYQISRIVPEGLQANIDATLWDLPVIFRWLIVTGQLEPSELAGTFNCGIGMALIVAKENASQVIKDLTASHEDAWVVGHIGKRSGASAASITSRLSSTGAQAGSLSPSLHETSSTPLPPSPQFSPLELPCGLHHPRKKEAECVSIVNTDCWTARALPIHHGCGPIEQSRAFLLGRRTKTAVLISGTGTNLQALLDASRNPSYPAEISLVVSNIASAGGLQRAQSAGIPSLVVSHKMHKSREEFEAALHTLLIERGIELIVLAGFTRILTDSFISKWPARVINIHPSLLPAFPGLHCHEKVLEAGVKVTGCTVHFILPGEKTIDCGPIIFQEAIAVDDDDTPESLQQKVKINCEWKLLPKVNLHYVIINPFIDEMMTSSLQAVALVAEGRVKIVDGRVRILSD